VFVVDGLNFCFWPNNKSGEFEYEHMTKNLAQLVTKEPSFFLPNELRQLKEEDLTEKVFNGKKDFALLGERTRILNEIGLII
jgi:hypothetical protein